MMTAGSTYVLSVAGYYSYRTYVFLALVWLSFTDCCSEEYFECLLGLSGQLLLKQLVVNLIGLHDAERISFQAWNAWPSGSYNDIMAGLVAQSISYFHQCRLLNHFSVHRHPTTAAATMPSALYSVYVRLLLERRNPLSDSFGERCGNEAVENSLLNQL